MKEPEEPLALQQQTKVFKAGSKVDGVFKDNPHTAWESYQNTMATTQYKTIMSGELYPKRSQLFDKTKSWEQELKDWEFASSKKTIADRNKSFSNFKETIY
jgi:hypothetical protein